MEVAQPKSVVVIVQALFFSYCIVTRVRGCNFNKRLTITIAGKLSQVKGLGGKGRGFFFPKMLPECVSPAHLPHSETDKRYARYTKQAREMRRKVLKFHDIKKVVQTQTKI